MAIVVLVLWLTTAGIGLTVLHAGGAARRVPRHAASAPVPARIGAIPLTEHGRPPPVPRATVATTEGEHPLLEFAHPGLAVVGLAIWAMFTITGYRPLAWISLGDLMLTAAVGFSWVARTRRDARRAEAPAWRFPGRLVLLHAAAAAGSLTVTVLVALIASRG